MLEQPYFGRRLKQLRIERGLSQAVLAGDDMSTGYLSRLESGARRPTARATEYLMKQLGVGAAEFEEQRVASLAHAFTVAVSAESDENTEALESALAADDGSNVLLRWQTLWLLAQRKRRSGEHAHELAHLEELVELGEATGVPALRVRAMTQLARCLRSSGEIARATDMATRAHLLARDNELSTSDLALNLLALISVETEGGRLPDACAHGEELLTLVEGRSDTLWAEAVWTVAAVRVRQGDLAAAQALLGRALEEFQSSENLVLWLRLRVASARLHLLNTPADPDAAQRCIEAIEAGLPFARSPMLEQELTFLKANLAFHEGRYMDARALLGQLDRTSLRLTHRDRVQVDVLDNRLRIAEGNEEEGLRGMHRLAQQAHETSNIDLAADIWRIAAETLVQVRNKPSGQSA
ncbi:Helix-turn-helix domain-containing protein [Streptomyces sp. 1222.5]|uniref:helix-turn-helix domain-containing protein n=1 Tax=unclassified Streptomyces TaxID=2593676 RepID=UPI00089AC2AC|nr:MULTISPECIES: helix-turn-helix domain-containing protein [unclassified Streptomyces]PKW00394.1 helix-turn-helix protein [Streptomyces sp. 5112.2]SED86952.1 Helix-turn-helix domain-containing protein [Streptomyces sp. 1222.5]